jgi:hypothetical protein
MTRLVRLAAVTFVALAATSATRLPGTEFATAGVLGLSAAMISGAVLHAVGRQASWGRRIASVSVIGLLAWPRVVTPLFPVHPGLVAFAGLLFLHELHATPDNAAPRLGENGKDVIARAARALALLAVLAIPLLFVLLADAFLPATFARTHELRHGGGGLLAGGLILITLGAIALARRVVRSTPQKEIAP